MSNARSSLRKKDDTIAINNNKINSRVSKPFTDLVNLNKSYALRSTSLPAVRCKSTPLKFQQKLIANKNLINENKKKEKQIICNGDQINTDVNKNLDGSFYIGTLFGDLNKTNEFLTADDKRNILASSMSIYKKFKV
jgi:hypothetical protein